MSTRRDGGPTVRICSHWAARAIEPLTARHPLGRGRPARREGLDSDWYTPRDLNPEPTD